MKSDFQIPGGSLFLIRDKYSLLSYDLRTTIGGLTFNFNHATSLHLRLGYDHVVEENLNMSVAQIGREWNRKFDQLADVRIISTWQYIFDLSDMIYL